MRCQIFFLIVLFLASGCEQDSEPIQFSVKAATNKGDPVAGAEVYFDYQLVGLTADNGVFKTELKINKSVGKDVKIIKTSPDYYFAPYYERLEIAADQTVVDISAILYFVEKPTKEHISAQVNPDIPASQLAAANAARQTAKESRSPTGPSGETERPTTHTPDASEEPRELAVIAVTADIKPLAKPDLATPEKPKAETITMNFYVKNRRKNLKGVEIIYAAKNSETTTRGCKTNKKGRCAITFPSGAEGAYVLFASKKGHVSQKREVKITQGGRKKIQMPVGYSLELFAYKKIYDYAGGLKGLKVFVDGKNVGKTDRFGHFSYAIKAGPDDLIPVRISAKGLLPQRFDTDFVANGPATLTRYFTPARPPRVRVVMLSTEIAGSVTNAEMFAAGSEFNRGLKKSLQKNLFNQPGLTLLPDRVFDEVVSQSKRQVTDLLKFGWANTIIKSKVDALLRPTIALDPVPTLELSLISSSGRIISAAAIKVSAVDDRDSIDAAVRELSAKLSKSFPFEGAVASVESKNILINVGKAHQRGLEIDDWVDIYGTQTSRDGDSKLHRRIGVAKITSIMNRTASATIIRIEPRALVASGDLVVLNHNQARTQQLIASQKREPSSFLQVLTESSTPEPVHQANVYWKGRWLGATNHLGQLTVPLPKEKGRIKILRHGFKPVFKQINFSDPKQSKEFSLRRETAMLRLQTDPSGALVRVDGRQIGRTPFKIPVSVPSGFVKLEVDAPMGYKKYSTVLELDEGTLDLSGPQMIKLERDLRTPSLSLLAAGRYQEAIDRLSEVPESHSDYLFAQHDIGDIYLSRLKNPENALSYFERIISRPEIATFNDKRFISAYINQGLALYLTAVQKGPNGASEAVLQLQKAIEQFKKVEPYLRFVPSKQFAEAAHNVGYYNALSLHKIWSITKDPSSLFMAEKAWQTYLSQTEAQAIPATPTSKGLRRNAEVYLRQAEVAANQQNKAVTR
jgi:tetratricopeptide (TPR) repeat protein